jgi:hypothetical protein
MNTKFSMKAEWLYTCAMYKCKHVYALKSPRRMERQAVDVNPRLSHGLKNSTIYCQTSDVSQQLTKKNNHLKLL